MNTTSPLVSGALADRAQQFTDLLTNIAADDHGVMRTAIHGDEMRPLEDGDIPLESNWAGHEDAVGFYAYEDAGMTTGSFLAAQSLCYRVTGKASALADARRAFAGIRHIYDLGRQRTEGYFPKPYGGRISNQISRDQYIFTMTGLMQFYTVADDGERARIARMLRMMARYWMSIDYRDSYFGLPEASHLDDFMGALFLGLIRLGCAVETDHAILTEYERLFTDIGLGARIGETLRGRFRNGETYDGAMYFRQQENPVMMKAMAVDYLWDADTSRRALWTDALKRFAADDLLVTHNPQTGMNYFIVGYDRDRDHTFLTEAGVIEQIVNPIHHPGLNWGGLRQSAGSTQTAYAAAVIGSRLGDRALCDTALNILRKLDLSRFRAWTVPDVGHIPPGEAWRQRTITTCYLSYWLWTYWLGRHRELWTSSSQGD